MAEEASKELGIPMPPEVRQELAWKRDLDKALEDADIATGDYRHRLRILVDHVIATRRPSNADELRRMAEIIPQAAESEYRKARMSIFRNWYRFDDRVLERYEERLGR